MCFCQRICLEIFNAPESNVNDLGRKQELSSIQYNLVIDYKICLFYTSISTKNTPTNTNCTELFFLCFELFKFVVKQR